MDIRNFCIIAHIDHGKSTLADRMLEITGTIEKRRMREQVLDAMELERERGITIKLQPVRMKWKGVTINLIDTPGHVDFQYEVSRSLAAVEGAVLLVDATQGVQAQTLSNLYFAMAQNLTIIPVINKIDLPAADVAGVMKEIIKLIGGREEDILKVSAKTGIGVEDVLDAVVKRVPGAAGPDKETLAEAEKKPLQALVFDSVYNDYKGVVTYVRMAAGQIKRGEEIKFIGTGASDRAVEVGTFNPTWQPVEMLSAGEIGYIATGLKDVRQARVGDTLTHAREKSVALAAFDIPQPKVFAGVYPERGDDYPRLREALGELQLNDASLAVQGERSEALGQGYRCGFLGMLHLDIVRERLRREHDLDLVVTTPSVKFKVWLKNGKQLEAATPVEFPDPSSIERVEEQYARVEILVPARYLGGVFELMKEREAVLEHQEYWGTERVDLRYVMPLRELVVDLYDQLKSVTAGYGSLSYELMEFRPAEVVKLNILVNHEPVEALAVIVAQSKALNWGKAMVTKLKNVIPKQLFAIPVQATIGGKIIARETIPAMRKDVTGYLYGGDVTRKKKLLEKQKKGKKKMAGVGKVVIPPEAYVEILKR